MRVVLSAVSLGSKLAIRGCRLLASLLRLNVVRQVDILVDNLISTDLLLRQLVSASRCLHVSL